MAREPGLRERAVRLLARREHTRAELAGKLAPHLVEGEDLEALLDELSRRDLLSDARYVESRIHRLGRKYGAARIERELRAKGLSKETAAAAATTARATELERAREVWSKKFRSLAKTREERARQARFLRQRGFSYDAIHSVIGRVEQG